MKTLIVTNWFGDYRLGDQITDPKQIEEILAGENAGSVMVTITPTTAE